MGRGEPQLLPGDIPRQQQASLHNKFPTRMADTWKQQLQRSEFYNVLQYMRISDMASTVRIGSKDH